MMSPEGEGRGEGGRRSGVVLGRAPRGAQAALGVCCRRCTFALAIGVKRWFAEAERRS
jgi:hypothetical protein